MPKITDHPVRIAGTLVKVAISYNQKNLFHVSGGLPDDVQVPGEMHTLRDHATEGKLLSALHDIITKHEAMLKSECYVIQIDAQVGQALDGELLGWNYQTKHPLRPKNRHFDKVPAYGFSFDFAVVRQLTVGKSVEHRELKNEQRDEVGRDMPYKTLFGGEKMILPYTPERAETLLNFRNAIVALGRKLADFFPADTEQLLLNLDRGSNLLLPVAPATLRVHDADDDLSGPGDAVPYTDAELADADDDDSDGPIAAGRETY